MVGGDYFKWSFNDRWDTVYYSQVTILANNKNTKIAIKFVARDRYPSGNPLNEGLLVIKDDTELSINLNEPKWIAEFLDFFRNNKMDFKDKRYYEIDGKDLLIQLGYIDTYSYLL